MQMIIQQHSRQPIEISLHGPISDEDAQILRQECLRLVHHLPPSPVWIHLEKISNLGEHELIVFHQLYQIFQQGRFQMQLITRKKTLYRRLQERGLPVHHSAPSSIINQAIVY